MSWTRDGRRCCSLWNN